MLSLLHTIYKKIQHGKTHEFTIALIDWSSGDIKRMLKSNNVDVWNVFDFNGKVFKESKDDIYLSLTVAKSQSYWTQWLLTVNGINIVAGSIPIPPGLAVAFSKRQMQGRIGFARYVFNKLTKKKRYT